MMEELQPAGSGRVTGLEQHKVLATERNSSRDNYITLFSLFKSLILLKAVYPPYWMDAVFYKRDYHRVLRAR